MIVKTRCDESRSFFLTCVHRAAARRPPHLVGVLYGPAGGGRRPDRAFGRPGTGHNELVIPARFRSLVDPTTFADDVQVRVSSDRSEAWLSEQLLDRLVGVGRAYGLHVLTVLAGMPRHEPAWINRQQAEGLVEEMEFVRSLLDADTAMTDLLSSLTPLVVEAARYGDENALVIEGP